MSTPNQFKDYRNFTFNFKKFDSLEDFKEKGEQAVDDFRKEVANGKNAGQFGTNFQRTIDGLTSFNSSFIGTDLASAESGQFIDYIDRNALDTAIDSFDSILEDIEMGGEIKKSKLKITDDKRGIFDFGIASKGLFRVVEFYSEELKNELPNEFPKLVKGIAQPDLVTKNALNQFVYISKTNNKSYFLKRRQKGTTEILNLKPDALVKTTENGIEHTILTSYEGVKLEFKSSIKKAYLMFEKKGGKAKYVDLYCVVGGRGNLEPIGMLNRTLPVLLAAKVLEEKGIKTRIYGTRMYLQEDNRGNNINSYVTYTFKMKDYSQDLDFNWLAINVADTRFFRWNLWKYVSAMLQLEGINDAGAGTTVYGGNELNEVFERYKNWYFEEIEAGREPESPIDRKLMITGGFSPKNRIEEDKIKDEFFRILDVVDFQFNTPQKAVQKIYNRFQKDNPTYDKNDIKSMTQRYVVRILSDAFAYPLSGQYATPLARQEEINDEFDKTIEEVDNYLKTI